MRELNHFDATKIHLEPGAGARIDLCAREAALVALEEGKDVSFMFNSSRYIARLHDIVNMVLRTKGAEE